MAKKIIKLTKQQLIKKIKKTICEHFAQPLNCQVPDNQSLLVEMARIDEPSRDNRILGTREVWVYGQDRSSMSPHFHYFNKKNKTFSIEVRISDLSVCFSQPRTGVPQNRLLSWYGLTDDKKALDEWLRQPNSDVPSITNYQAIKLAWNQNNRDNPV